MEQYYNAKLSSNQDDSLKQRQTAPGFGMNIPSVNASMRRNSTIVEPIPEEDPNRESLRGTTERMKEGRTQPSSPTKLINPFKN